MREHVEYAKRIFVGNGSKFPLESPKPFADYYTEKLVPANHSLGNWPVLKEMFILADEILKEEGP